MILCSFVHNLGGGLLLLTRFLGIRYNRFECHVIRLLGREDLR